ncbi:hypothetical protein FOFC_20508 [Fusarium oxysporum]|nr:hypothetical protein FOFC_20508 [Fusarium oxysporum]
MRGVEMVRLSGVKRLIVVKLDKTLEEDYDSISDSTIGHQNFSSLIRNRATGTIRSKRYTSVQDLTDLQYLVHPDIATIYSIYGAISNPILVEEYLELSLADLFQLTEVEIACATTQIISGFRHLSEVPVAVELDEIRVSLAGRVKIGNDF